MEEIDLKQLFDMFWSRKIIIFLIILIFIGMGTVYTKFMIKPDYKSVATLVLTKKSTDDKTITQTELTLNQKLVATYTQLVRSDIVLAKVIENLNSQIDLNTLRNSISVNMVTSTQFIEISVKNEKPETAQLLAKEISNVFIDKIKEIYKMDNISIFDEPKINNKPYNINYIKNISIFTIIGIAVSIAYVFLVSMLDTSIKSQDEAEKRLELNVLAQIPNYNLENKNKITEKEELITYNDPKSPIAEIFRTLRTNIQFMASNKALKTLLVTSSMPGEGKSWVSANLILAFAKEGKKVLIVDADMRKGRMHKVFNIDKKPGLSNYLSGIIDKEDKDNVFNYIKRTNIENLYIMPTGDVPPNPSELLLSERTTKLVETLKGIFDMVIFDGTPSLIVTDAVILARQVDATLIVTAYKTTKMGDIEKIKKHIEKVGGKIAGIVINKIPISAKKYENSYYYGHKEISSKKEHIEAIREVQEIDTIEKIDKIEDDKINTIETRAVKTNLNEDNTNDQVEISNNDIENNDIENNDEEIEKLAKQLDREIEEEMNKIKNTNEINDLKDE